MKPIVRKFAENGDVLRTFEVKNLGWLYDHREEVTSIHLHGQHGGRVWLQAYLTVDGIKYSYVSDFGEFSIMKQWVNKRRCWKATPVKFL